MCRLFSSCLNTTPLPGTSVGDMSRTTPAPPIPAAVCTVFEGFMFGEWGMPIGILISTPQVTRTRTPASCVYKHHPTTTGQQCCDYCADTPSCVAWMWKRSDSICFLISGTSDPLPFKRFPDADFDAGCTVHRQHACTSTQYHTSSTVPPNSPAFASPAPIGVLRIQSAPPISVSTRCYIPGPRDICTARPGNPVDKSAPLSMITTATSACLHTCRHPYHSLSQRRRVALNAPTATTARAGCWMTPHVGHTAPAAQLLTSPFPLCTMACTCHPRRRRHSGHRHQNRVPCHQNRVPHLPLPQERCRPHQATRLRLQSPPL